MVAGLRTRVHLDDFRVERFVVLRPDLEAIAHKESRFPTRSSAALPSCSAFVAIQVPCNVVSAALAGSAQARTSPVEIINQHIAEVRRSDQLHFSRSVASLDPDCSRLVTCAQHPAKGQPCQPSRARSTVARAGPVADSRMSYRTSLFDSYRQAGIYAGKTSKAPRPPICRSRRSSRSIWSSTSQPPKRSASIFPRICLRSPTS